MRSITEQMLSCISACIHAPCVTFDGQWYKLKDEMKCNICNVRKIIGHEKISSHSEDDKNSKQILVLYSEDKSLQEFGKGMNLRKCTTVIMTKMYWRQILV